MIKIIKNHIVRLLTNHEHLRDNDLKLIATIWYGEVEKHGLSKADAKHFLDLFAAGKLTNPESIRRSRQQVQERNSHLRGKRYGQKQSNVSRIQFELGYNTKN